MGVLGRLPSRALNLGVHFFHLRGLVLMLGVMFGLYLVWSCKEYIKRRLETELIRYQEPWQMVAALADDVAAEEARELNYAARKVSGSSAPAMTVLGPRI